MRILLLNQFFWPDPAATSQLLTDLACHFASEDHSVTVICGTSGYTAEHACADTAAPPSVCIERLPIVRFGRSTAMRSLSYATFLAAATWRALRVRKQDVVITLTTPPLVSLIGTLVKKVRGSRHFAWEMDVYPDVAVDLRFIRKKSLIAWVVGLFADHSRKHADGVIALGECMRERLLARGVPSRKIHVAENWADGLAIVPKAFRFGEGLTLLYSGNLGPAHEVKTILGAIDTLKTEDRFRFIFAGGGRRYQTVRETCTQSGAKNVSFRPYCARDRLSESLGEADVGLVLQENACVGSVVPSKTYGLMAAGRPILFVGPKHATPGQIIRRFECGWQIECGDEEGLIALLRQLEENPQLVRDAGDRARKAFMENYDLPIGVVRIAAILGVHSSQVQESVKAVGSHGIKASRSGASA